MKYVNNKGLSPLIAGFIESSMKRYSAGDSDYSTTTLIDAPRPVYLKREHFDEIEKDVSDMMAAFIGNAIHDYLEQLAEGTDHIVEKRLFAEIDGKKISGCIDILEFIKSGLYKVGDYKTTKVWAVTLKPEDTFRKWEEQLNINAWLCHKNGIEVCESAFIEAFFMDFQKGRAGTGLYPKVHQKRYEFKLWSLEEQEAFVRERILLHEEAKELLPYCTEKEMWKDNEWKLFKKGRKTAVKKEYGQKDIEAYARGKKILRPDGTLINGYSIECIQGEYKRCKEYCDGAAFCEQWKENKG